MEDSPKQEEEEEEKRDPNIVISYNFFHTNDPEEKDDGKNENEIKSDHIE